MQSIKKKVEPTIQENATQLILQQNQSSIVKQPQIIFRERSQFASRTVHQQGRKKKFITRIKEFNPQSSNHLTNSYENQSMGYSQADSVSARQKNNMAARISRKRKKMYVELLEEQNLNLQMELFTVNEEIEMLRTQIFNAIMHTEQVNTKNGEIQSLVVKKLKALTQNNSSSQTDGQINICLDSCIYRIGASGSERRAILDILYKGFINRNLPNIYRFIMWSSIHRRTISEGEKAGENWWDLIKSDLMKSSYDIFLVDRGDAIAAKGTEILRCSKQILSKKKQIQDSGQLFDHLIKQMRQILTPTQFTQLFLFADRATPKKEMRIFQDNEEDQVKVISVNKQIFSNPSYGNQGVSGRKKKKLIELCKIQQQSSFSNI